MLNPSDLNAVARLVMVAERCGPEFLDNADRFDQVIGRGRFSETNCNVLNLARAIIKSKLNGVETSAIDLADFA